MRRRLLVVALVVGSSCARSADDATEALDTNQQEETREDTALPSDATESDTSDADTNADDSSNNTDLDAITAQDSAPDLIDSDTLDTQPLTYAGECYDSGIAEPLCRWWCTEDADCAPGSNCADCGMEQCLCVRACEESTEDVDCADYDGCADGGSVCITNCSSDADCVLSP